MPVCVKTKVIAAKYTNETVFVPADTSCQYLLVTQSELESQTSLSTQIANSGELSEAFYSTFWLILCSFLLGRFIGVCIELVRKG